MGNQTVLNQVLQKKINEINQEPPSIKNTPSETQKVQPKNKKSLKDNDLINSIDDFDKDQWVKLRTSYANKLYWLLVGEIVSLFLLLLLIGCDVIQIEESTINITIVAVIVQTFGLVKEIVTNLFKRNSH